MTDADRTLNPSALVRKNRATPPPAAEPESRTLQLGPRPAASPEIVREPIDDTVSVTGEPAAANSATAAGAAPTFAPTPATTTDIPVAPVAPVLPPPVFDEGTKSMTVRIRTSIRNRAREAYRVTGYQEGDNSFEKFVEAALEREITRREQLYNGGRQYPGQDRPLSPGRAV